MFSRRQVFEVYLTARGRKHLIAEVEAKNFEDLYVTVHKMLEEYAEEHPEEIKRYNRVLVVNKKTGERLRFKNPFYEEEEEDRGGNKPSGEDLTAKLQALTVAAVVQQIPDLVGEAVRTAMSVQRRILEKTLEAAMESAKPSPTSQLRDIALFVQSLVQLAQNKDKVAALVKEAWSGVGEVTKGGGSKEAGKPENE
jgi:hypothetical protein